MAVVAGFMINSEMDNFRIKSLYNYRNNIVFVFC